MSEHFYNLNRDSGQNDNAMSKIDDDVDQL